MNIEIYKETILHSRIQSHQIWIEINLIIVEGKWNFQGNIE